MGKQILGVRFSYTADTSSHGEILLDGLMGNIHVEYDQGTKTAKGTAVYLGQTLFRGEPANVSSHETAREHFASRVREVIESMEAGR
jgi:hypothetical protein